MKKAFTLIELSIAMLILGLLISGILVANKMVNAAKLRRLVKEKDQLEQAILDFTVQYGALPGSKKMYDEIGDYPGLGSQSNYYDYNTTYPLYWPIKSMAYFAQGRGCANAMLQMNRSSGGVYPEIKLPNLNGSAASGDIDISTYLHKSSFSNNVFLGFGFVQFGIDTSSDAHHKYEYLGPPQELAFANQIFNKSTVPSNFRPFLNKHVIILNGNYKNLYSWYGRLGESALSTSDSIQMSQKYDSGNPYGSKIFFGFQRPGGGGAINPDPIIQNQCVTATSFAAGDSKNQIGLGTKFLTTGNNLKDPSKGCVVAFATNIDV